MYPGYKPSQAQIKYVQNEIFTVFTSSERNNGMHGVILCLYRMFNTAYPVSNILKVLSICAVTDSAYAEYTRSKTLLMHEEC
jgi:hypothetical protein